jgi:hypothetical protein
MRLKKLPVMTVLVVISGCILSNALAQNGDEKSFLDLPRQCSATAFGQAGSMAGKSFGLNLYISGWTTDQQVKDFIGVLKEEGPNGLVKAMDKTDDVGRLSPTGFVGSGFRFARYRATENDRRTS